MAEHYRERLERRGDIERRLTRHLARAMEAIEELRAYDKATAPKNTINIDGFDIELARLLEEEFMMPATEKASAWFDFAALRAAIEPYLVDRLSGQDATDNILRSYGLNRAQAAAALGIAVDSLDKARQRRRARSISEKNSRRGRAAKSRTAIPKPEN